MPRLPTTLAAMLAAMLASPFAQAACESYPQELATMVSADQAVRERMDYNNIKDPAQQKLMGHMGVVDGANTARLKVLFEACGFPDKDRHGEQAQHHAWLLVQHADHDVAFQKRTLELLEQMAKRRGEQVRPSFAYLADRIAVAENQPQRYGTQLMWTDQRPCVFEFSPMDAREKVEARRAALGMPPLDVYYQQVVDNANCVPPAPANPADTAAQQPSS